MYWMLEGWVNKQEEKLFEERVTERKSVSTCSPSFSAFVYLYIDVCLCCVHAFMCLPAQFSLSEMTLSGCAVSSPPLTSLSHLSSPLSSLQIHRADSLMFNAHSGSRHAQQGSHAHTHTPLLHPPSDAILITSLRFDLSPLDQMADVFILEGEEMNQEWLHIAQSHKKERSTSVSEDDCLIVFVYQQRDQI